MSKRARQEQTGPPEADYRRLGLVKMNQRWTHALGDHVADAIIDGSMPVAEAERMVREAHLQAVEMGLRPRRSRNYR